MPNLYKDYFEIDENYFPVIDQHSIESGAKWQDTFPHETVVGLFKRMERMLARSTNNDKHGIWIEGAYGTGKSRVAWTMKNLLDCPTAKLEAYFDRYDPLRKQPDLKRKLLAHKTGRIVTAMRFSSNEILGDRDLVRAVYDSVSESLTKAGMDPLTGKSLKGSIVNYLSGAPEKTYFEQLLQMPEYRGLGSLAGKSVDAIVAQLSDPEKESGALVRDLMRIAEERGVTGLAMSVDDLVGWITEVVETNGITALVLFWDEFSDYFKSNRNVLGGFQNLAALSKSVPFYFVIVTHESGSLIGADQGSRLVLDRFGGNTEKVEIPDTIAFELIRDALKVKDAQRDFWKELRDDLASRMRPALKAVRAYAWRGAPNGGEGVLEGILPIHPMAALLLKNISAYFASNQRSMFNFIKDDEGDELHAFQWFISHASPDNPDVLGIDSLWDFFYVSGRDPNATGTGRGNLALGVRSVLDTYSIHANSLGREEQRVLKTVLMMQAMNTVLGESVPLFRVTPENLELAFAGIEGLENHRATNIARLSLCTKEILYEAPTPQGGTEFKARTSILSGENQETIKREFRGTKTAALVQDGRLKEILPLKPAQQFRFDMETATAADFTTVTNKAANKYRTDGWLIPVVLCFARESQEGTKLHEAVLAAVNNANNTYKNIVFIDATQNTMSTEQFERWVDYMASAKALRNQDRTQSDRNTQDAQRILDDWRNSFAGGPFTVYWEEAKSGIVRAGTQQVLETLSEIVVKKFPLAFDTVQGATNNQFADGRLKASVADGIKGAANGYSPERFVSAALGAARSVAEYWSDPTTERLSISVIKKSLDEKIGKALRKEGRIEIKDVFGILVAQGFMPCNLYAYLAGFLLKEYADAAYRWGDDTAPGGPMSPDKLAELLDAAIKDIGRPGNRYKPVFLQLMTKEQKAFTKLAAEAFGVGEDLSIEQWTNRVRSKLGELGFPLWCLAPSADDIVKPFLEKFAAFANPANAGENASKIAGDTGRMASAVPGAGTELKEVLSRGAAEAAMRSFLGSFEEGEVMAAADAIRAKNPVADARRIFTSGDGTWLWNEDVGRDQLRKLARDYRIVEAGNAAMGTDCRALSESVDAWREKIKALRLPQSDITARKPALKPVFQCVREMERTGDLPHEKRDAFLDTLLHEAPQLRELFGAGAKALFREIYAPHLAGLGEEEIGRIWAHLPVESFLLDKNAYLAEVLALADRERKQQARYRLEQFWQEKTGSRNARDWSRLKKTPALAMFLVEEEADAKRALDALDRTEARENDVAFALEWLGAREETLARMSDAKTIDAAFRERVVQPFASVLPDLNAVRLKLDAMAGEPDGWLGDAARRVVETAAEEAYATSGRQAVLERIAKMDADTLRTYLQGLISDVRVGAAILAAEEDE